MVKLLIGLSSLGHSASSLEAFVARRISPPLQRLMMRTTRSMPCGGGPLLSSEAALVQQSARIISRSTYYLGRRSYGLFCLQRGRIADGTEGSARSKWDKTLVLATIPEKAEICRRRSDNGLGFRDLNSRQNAGRNMKALGYDANGQELRSFCGCNQMELHLRVARMASSSGVVIESEKDREGEDEKKEGEANRQQQQQQPELELYNTMSKQKEKFRPKVAGKVSMYVCGVTSYDYSHIGHARVYVAFDVLFRYVPSSLLWSLTHLLQPQQFAESFAVHHSFSCALFFFNQYGTFFLMYRIPCTAALALSLSLSLSLFASIVFGSILSLDIILLKVLFSSIKHSV